MTVSQFVKHPHTDADVSRLLQAFLDIVPDGRVIAHESVETVLNIHRGEARYRTVVNHWRCVLFQEHRVFLDGRAAQGVGFKALTPDEMVRYANREVRAVGRRLRRAVMVAAMPSDNEIVDPSNRLYRARLLSGTEQMIQAHGRVLRELGAALRPPKQLRA